MKKDAKRPEISRKKAKALSEKVKKLETLIEDIKTARAWSENRLTEKLREMEKTNRELEEKILFLSRMALSRKPARASGRAPAGKNPKKTAKENKKAGAENGFSRDLERAFQKRKELERIISDSPAVVFLWGASEGWPIEFVSDNIQRFGYRPEDFYFKRLHYASIVHPDDLEKMATEADRYIERGKDSFTQEYRIMTASGEVRWLEDHTWVRRDPSGRITHYQGILLDITERKEAAEALLQAEKMAAVGTMAASVAHELRSPLGVIKLAVDNIDYRLDKKNEKTRKSLEYIDQKVSEATKIINDLLNYSRLGRPDLAPADINALAEEALSNVIIEFPAKDIRIIKKFGKLPRIKVDRVQMRGVFQNIIKNAIEAVGRDGRLTLTTKYSKKDKTASVSFSDNGCGIPAEDIEKLEKPFFSTKANGTGLGLSLSFRVVKENHKGSIRVKSGPGKGTTFTVVLPR